MFNRANFISGHNEKSHNGRSFSAQELVSDQNINRCKFLSKVPAAIFSLILLLMFYHGFANPWNETFDDSVSAQSGDFKTSIGITPINHDVISRVSADFKFEFVYENEVEDESWPSRKNKRFVRLDVAPFYTISGKFDLFQTLLQPDFILTGASRRISKNVLFRVFRL